MRQKLAVIFCLMFATCVHAQGIGGTGGIGGKGGVGGGAPSGGQFTLVQKVAGTTNCNGNNLTCTVPITTTAGNTQVIVMVAAHLSLIQSMLPNCGKITPVPQIDTNGRTSTQGGAEQVVIIFPSDSIACTNPVLNFDIASNTAAVEWYELSCASGGCGVSIDAYFSTKNTGAAGSPFNGQALTCTSSGTNAEAVIQFADANGASGVTAVASPYNTNFAAMAPNNIFAGGASVAIGNSCPTPSWTAASNTSVVFGGVALGTGATPSKDWTIVSPLQNAGSTGNIPAVADLNANTAGYVGGGNNASNPAWAAPANGTTGLTYTSTTPAGCGAAPTINPTRLTATGATFNNTISGYFLWTTTTGTKGSLPWSPPINTTVVTDGIWYCTDIPNTENASTQYSLGEIVSVTDEINFRILPNTGTSVPIYYECDSSTTGLIFNAVTQHWYWLTRRFVSGGTSTLQVYDNDGKTQLGSQTCATSTGSGQVTSVSYPGISGAELESITSCSGGPCHIWFSGWKIDRTGAQFPILPGS